jgi:uncharacterized GH25 family protein
MALRPPVRSTSLIVVFMAALFAGSTSLTAHDLWIDPTTFLPEPGKIVGLRLRVGENLIGDPVPRVTSLINEFVFHDAASRKPVIGADGRDPAGLMRVATPGLLVVGYHSKPSVVDLTAEKFNQYLREEGLDDIAALRARRRQSNASTREMFTRCAKSLVLAGAVQPGQLDRALGFPLELVAEANPYASSTGDPITFRLTYEGKPLAGIQIVAMSRGHADEKLTTRSNADGRVTLRLPRSGVWLVKAVHMVPAAIGADAEWASYWASLTFETGAVR